MGDAVVADFEHLFYSNAGVSQDFHTCQSQNARFSASRSRMVRPLGVVDHRNAVGACFQPWVRLGVGLAEDAEFGARRCRNSGLEEHLGVMGSLFCDTHQFWQSR